MPKEKPRYNREPTFAETIITGVSPSIQDFSKSLRAQLKALYPDDKAKADPVWGHPADQFVEELFAAARGVLPHLANIQRSLSKADIHAERDDLLRTLIKVRDGLKTLPKAQKKLRQLSPDFDRWLDVDPLECADSFEMLIQQETIVGSTLERMIVAIKSAKSPNKRTRKLSPRQAQHEVAVELAVRVLRVANRHGVKIAATADPDFGSRSTAVRLIKMIGDDIGLSLANVTWRDIIIEAKPLVSRR